MLSEISQSEKAVYSVIPFIWHSGEGRTMEQLKGQRLPEDWVG